MWAFFLAVVLQARVFFVIPDIPIGSILLRNWPPSLGRLVRKRAGSAWPGFSVHTATRTVLARAGPALAHYWKVSWVSSTQLESARLGSICARSHCNFASRPTRAKVSWPAFLCQCEHSISASVNAVLVRGLGVICSPRWLLLAIWTPLKTKLSTGGCLTTSEFVCTTEQRDRSREKVREGHRYMFRANREFAQTQDCPGDCFQY